MVVQHLALRLSTINVGGEIARRPHMILASRAIDAKMVV
jgi:hypothetical protein